MVATDYHVSDRDERLNAVLADYLDAVESGQPDDRPALLARHPDLATDLQAFFAEQDGMADLASPLRAVIQPQPLELAPGVLGDYRIVREVGRGGMGVVYEAEQISLGRRVALKVLPFAATMDPKHLQRFHNEAKAAASLHHEHIVPVYAVGCERGVHYYAMQFIDGATLAQVIEGLNQEKNLNHRATEDTEKKKITAPLCSLCLCGKNSFRTIAALIADAADALEYAHSVGIVHRDVKPGNLLIDAAGKVWIADFGLARFGPDAGLTMTGDLLGTLRYMAPEQALAKHGLVDHRADIYGLGATLYELLTGKPAVGGEDKQEILKRIAFEEPVALRKLDKTIPAELETTSLKALAKEPGDRYATAGELADDLKRFLDDQPIRARRPTPLQRSRKWLRRHKAAAAATGITAIVLLTMAVVGLLVTSFRIAREEARTRAALNDAQQSHHRADTNFQKALDSLDHMFAMVGKERRSDLPEVKRLRRKLLENGLQFCQQFLHEERSDPAGRLELARLQAQMAQIYTSLRRPQDAERAAGLARKGLEDLLAEFPAEAIYRHRLADLHYWIGQCLDLGPGRRAETEDTYRRAIDLWEQAPVDSPDAAGAAKLGRAYHELGYHLQSQPGRGPDAEQWYRRALELQRKLAAESPRAESGGIDVMRTLNSLGLLLRLAGRPKEAEWLHRDALRVSDELAKDFPARESRFENARSHNHLALALWLLERREEALEHLRQGLALHQEAVTDSATDSPWFSIHGQEIGPTYRILGRMLEVMKQDQEAEDAYRRALALAKEFVVDFPEPVQGQQSWIATHVSLARFLAARGRTREADVLFEELRNYDPAQPAAQNHLAWLLVAMPDAHFGDPKRAVVLAGKAAYAVPDDGAYWNTLGVARYRAGDWKSAAAALERSMQLGGGGNGFDWFFLAMTRWQLGDKRQAREWNDRAVRWMEKNKPDDGELRHFRAEAAALLHGAPPPGEGNLPKRADAPHPPPVPD